ncbi:putative quinol monooxygenase [Fulvivirga ligni]|uniref:putative quinol monooxygenase n=1 Tax=Fulvivirga ligni TaxID=2904246 RepID=UPI001F3CC5FC|nr:antibiotic biosynthesis monooxygenase [Fulvivirga ligni]UII19028.1 antibiotic biosynthesis monooxygenase [Fulvivirga ligni]
MFNLKTVNKFKGIIILLVCCSCGPTKSDQPVNLKDQMVRIAEIEIDSAYFEDYISILKEESEASYRLEDGVICIYPMYIKNEPTAIRLLEIYANREAYESHLKTEHFLKYKTSTQKMVKSLKLIDMEPIDLKEMPHLFVKLNK